MSLFKNIFPLSRSIESAIDAKMLGIVVLMRYLFISIMIVYLGVCLVSLSEKLIVLTHSQGGLDFTSIKTLLTDSLFVLGQERPIILVDGSDLSPDKRFILIRASVPMGGRSSVVYQEVHQGKKDGNRTVLRGFLNALKAIIPEGARPIIVTDAGFRTPWFEDVQAMNWDWVGRIRHSMLRRNDEDTWVYCKDIYPLFENKPCDLGQFEITRSNPLHCRLVGVKKSKKGRIKKTAHGNRCESRHSMKNADREREPWLLATSLSDVTAAEVLDGLLERAI